METILKDVAKQEAKTERRITRGLMFLEERMYELALKEVELILRDSEFIEARMAALSIKHAATIATEEFTAEYLKTIYNI